MKCSGMKSIHIAACPSPPPTSRTLLIHTVLYSIFFFFFVNGLFHLAFSGFIQVVAGDGISFLLKTVTFQGFSSSSFVL